MKLLFAGMALLCLSLPAASQSRNTDRPRLVTNSVDNARVITLRGNTHSMARPAFDGGVSPADLSMDHMLLVLKRSAQQDADLGQLLEDQQNSASSEFHHWLTPDEFGERFGPSAADIAVVTTWLESQGFRIDSVPAGRGVVEFSGTAETVRNAFHTPIHGYVVNGKHHWANATDPQIPAALAPVVAGIASLHNFNTRPEVRLFGTTPATIVPGATPQANLGGGTQALSPGDYAVIYNAKPLLSGGITGTSRTIAVLGRSNINLQDVADFRRIFNLPTNTPQLVLNGSDPGNLGGNEELEAVLDTSWAGALAPGATVKLVVSASTNSSDGVFLSELYAVNNNVADIISESFGSCEADYTQSSAAYLSSLAQQAAAQGQTFVVSSGDSGSAGCDSPTASASTRSPSVNMLASTPYTVAVGGTQFNESGSTAFWATSNSMGAVSATSYIPENVWNQSCSSSSCGSSANLYSAGGGASQYFGKPSWQSGVSGIPQDGFRDVPDVALSAAAAHDPYLLCLRGSCSGNSTSLYLVGGTSASAPSFAGIMALVDQQAGGRQGLANPNLYRLAAQQSYGACNGSNSSALPSANCVFNDITVGNNAVPGATGYWAQPGYDLASGLGSVNVTNLVYQWNGATSTSPSAYYGIIGLGSGRALDDSGASLSASPIVLWDWTGSLDEQWQLVPVETGYYKIVNRLSGKAIDAAGASTSNGASAIQWDFWGGDNQKWQLIAIDSQNYRIVNKLSGKVLDCAGAGTANGNPIIQWDWWGGINQKWRLTPMK